MLTRRKRKLSERRLIAEADLSAKQLLSIVDELAKTYRAIKALQDILRQNGSNDSLIDLIQYTDKNIMGMEGKMHVIKDLPVHTEEFNTRYYLFIHKNELNPYEEANRRYRSDLEKAAANFKNN